MSIRSLAAILATTIALTGCQAAMYGTASDMNRVTIGMTKDQVITALGAPTSVSADGATHEEKLMYKKMPQTIGWLPHTYEVALIDGKVAHYGEVH